jgi:hypothetical protein
MYRPDIGYV